MTSQIKIVKRKEPVISTSEQAKSKSMPVEPTVREITTVVKQWVAEFKERKRNHQASLSPHKSNQARLSDVIAR